MSPNPLPQAELTTVATFPPQFFLENLVMRADHSLLITVLNRGELWYVPPVDGALPVEPVLLFNFRKDGRGENASGIVEAEPDVFYLASSNWYTTGESYLYRLDLRGWKPGSNVVPELVFEFPRAARCLNGICLIAPKVLLAADSFAGRIWRVDLGAGGARPQAREWLAHWSMGYFPGAMKPEQPGVNGIRFAAKTNALYYTATAKKLLMRVRVDPQTHEAAGEPELVVAGRMGDDFCIDEDREVLYLTTHRQNTIDRVSMNPARNSGFTQSVAGDPYTEELIGPSSGIWGRGGGEYGRVAYFVTDGGTASPPPDGVVRPAKVLRVSLHAGAAGLTVMICALLLSSMLFIGAAAAQTPYRPALNGYQLRPTQQQLESKWYRWNNRVAPEVDRLYGQIMHAATKQGN